MTAHALQVLPMDDLDPGAWDAFCRESDDAWFFHTTAYQEYVRAYRPDWNPRSHSFALLDDVGIIAACPLVEETLPAEAGGGAGPARQFGAAYGGMGACPFPALRNGLAPKRAQQVLQAAMEHIDHLAQQRGVLRSSQRIYPLAPAARATPHLANPLPRHGYWDTSIATQLIDLTRSEDDLWHDLSKGHRYDARRGAHGIGLVVADHASDPSVVDAYRELHARAAGRLPRPLETYACQARWFRDGDALLVGAHRDDRWLAFAFLLWYKDGAYYMSGCEEPEGDPDRPVGHAVQWHAIKALRDRGVRTYETGWQPFVSQPQAPATGKELDIAGFKRRFGGDTVALWSGERFYDGRFMAATMTRRIEGLRADIPGP